jgi:hypothetical protein
MQRLGYPGTGSLVGYGRVLPYHARHLDDLDFPSFISRVMHVECLSGLVWISKSRESRTSFCMESSHLLTLNIGVPTDRKCHASGVMPEVICTMTRIFVFFLPQILISNDASTLLSIGININEISPLVNVLFAAYFPCRFVVDEIPQGASSSFKSEPASSSVIPTTTYSDFDPALSQG